MIEPIETMVAIAEMAGSKSRASSEDTPHDACERRHGIYTMYDGSTWDSGTNKVTPGPTGGWAAVALARLPAKPKPQPDISFAVTEPSVRQRRMVDGDDGKPVEQEWRGKALGWQRVRNVANLDSANSTEALIQERHTTHGSFADNARISQKLKGFFADQKGWEDLSFIQQESLDMIALKISRILSGRAGECDHWDDIAGYAKLASKEASAAKE